MRPVISRLYEHNGKTCLLPESARLNEQMEFVRVLGIKDEKDEDDLRIIEYRSLIGVVPDASCTLTEIDDTARCLAMLTSVQLDAVKFLCAEFNLTYHNVSQFFEFIQTAKGVSHEQLHKIGVLENKDIAEESI